MLKNSLLRLKEVAKETRDRYACGDNNLGDEKSNAFSAVIENISASFFLLPSPAKKKTTFFWKMDSLSSTYSVRSSFNPLNASLSIFSIGFPNRSLGKRRTEDKR